MKLSQAEKEALLAEISFFGDMDAEVLGSLTAVVHTVTLLSRKELFHKGDDATAIFVLASGRLKIVTTSKRGEDLVLNVIHPGEVIGEIALFSATTRTATVVALEPCVLVKIDRRDFLSFLRINSEVAIQLLTVLADRIVAASELVEDTHFLNLPLRLAKQIIKFADVFGEDTPGGRRINLKFSQREWGQFVGASRESVNKQMRRWTRDGLLSIDHGRVTVHRLEDFQKMLGQVTG